MKVLNRLKNRYWFVLKGVWNVCSKPDRTLNEEELNSAFESKNVFKNGVLPMAEMLMFVGFITTILYNGEWQFGNALVRAMFVGIIFISSYGAIFAAAKLIINNIFDIEVENRDIDIMVISLMTVTFVVKLLQLILPDLFFVTFFYVYLLYLVWLISDSIIKIPEGKRNRFMIIMCIIIVSTPWIIKKIMMLMVPNL